MELVFLAVLMLARKEDGPWFFVADLAQKVSWWFWFVWAWPRGDVESRAVRPMSVGIAVLVAYVYSASILHPAAATVANQALNELVDPVECAFVLYASGALRRHFAKGQELGEESSW